MKPGDLVRVESHSPHVHEVPGSTHPVPVGTVGLVLVGPRKGVDPGATLLVGGQPVRVNMVYLEVISEAR
jgi:hypothetical protein